MTIYVQTATFDTKSCFPWAGSGSAGGAHPHLACFAADTLIEADGGAVPVAALRQGHRVWTRNAGMLAILDVARIAPDPRRSAPRALRVPAGTLGPGLPRQDVVLASAHRLLLPVADAGIGHRLSGPLTRSVRARDLPGISAAGGPVECVALLLAAPGTLCAAGLLCESFEIRAAWMHDLFRRPTPDRSSLRLA